MSACWLGSRNSIVLALVMLVVANALVLSRTAHPAEKVVRIGFVIPESAANQVVGIKGFWERMRELGWIEGKNLVIEKRWADGRNELLPGIMADVVSRKVDVIVTISTPAAIAARNATSTIPIVVAGMGDPFGSGLASSLARPGGNVTGFSLQFDEGIPGKWLELLRESLPGISAVAVIYNSGNPLNRLVEKQLNDAAPSQALKLIFVEVRDPAALGDAFRGARKAARAVVVLPDPVTVQNRRRIAELAAIQGLPVIYPLLEFVHSGGLMAYGVDHAVLLRRAAAYVDRILRGTQVADLPIEQPTQFSLAVNLKAARALGITIPQSILLRADEVIR